MSYQDAAGDLASDVQAQLAAAFAAYLAGNLTADALTAVVAAFLAAANNGAAALGALALAASVTVETGQPAAPYGAVRPLSDPDRLEQAARTILADLDPAETASVEHAQMRLDRLVESEIRKATADAYAAALTETPAVTGWIRGLEPDACQLCVWWWREGRVWPADHPIPRHQGCDCSQLVVTTNQIKPVRNH